MEYDDDGLAGKIVYEHPMTVGSRGRLWATESLRRQLGINSDSYGYGSRLLVRLAVHDRDPSWGSAVESAIFPTTLGVDGVIRPPKSVRERLSLSDGDHVRVTLYRPRGDGSEAAAGDDE
jgi:hypothetical protein